MRYSSSFFLLKFLRAEIPVQKHVNKIIHKLYLSSLKSAQSPIISIKPTWKYLQLVFFLHFQADFGWVSQLVKHKKYFFQN